VTIRGDDTIVSYGQLAQRIRLLKQWLLGQQVTCLGIRLDNEPNWVISDLAAMSAGISTIPILQFFTPEQTRHLICHAEINCVIANSDTVLPGLFSSAPEFCRPTGASSHMPRKITFTSGSTGQPKGVVLANETLVTVANSILTATSGLTIEKHLCVLPLSILLENVAGLYAPLIKGIDIIVPSSSNVGLTGSSQLDLARCAQCLDTHQPHSLILVPQLLAALTSTLSLW